MPFPGKAGGLSDLPGLGWQLAVRETHGSRQGQKRDWDGKQDGGEVAAGYVISRPENEHA